MLLSSVYIIAGLLLLVKGGDYLVTSSVAIAQRLHLSPLIIGITVIGFGTSMPELCVSLQAAIAHTSGIALGNVTGSNICNIALILGITAIIHPAPASRGILRRTIPSLIIAMMLLIVFAYTGTIQRWMGILMFALIIFQMTLEIRTAKQMPEAAEACNQQQAETTGVCVSKQKRQNEACTSKQAQTTAVPGSDASDPKQTKTSSGITKNIMVAAISIAAMIFGSSILVKGATHLATIAGTSMGADPKDIERIIALTIVAVGTSLPELCASVIAARRGDTDMAIGNIAGSGIFNILCVVGASSAIAPISNAWESFYPDYITQLVLCLLLWLFLFTKRTLERWEGFVFLALYVAYISFITLSID